MRACVRACMHAYMRALMRMCVSECVCACVYVCVTCHKNNIPSEKSVTDIRGIAISNEEGSCLCHGKISLGNKVTSAVAQTQCATHTHVSVDNYWDITFKKINPDTTFHCLTSVLIPHLRLTLHIHYHLNHVDYLAWNSIALRDIP